MDFESWQKIYVCNVMGHRLYELADLDEDSVKLTPRLNGQWELNFTATRQRDTHDVAFESLCEGMYLLVENVGYFKLRMPTIDMDAATETKQISALSCDSELEDKNLDISINTGLEESQEYLVKYDDGEVELLKNPYKNIPYDWIVLDNQFPAQLEELVAQLDPGSTADVHAVVMSQAEAAANAESENRSALPPWIIDGATDADGHSRSRIRPARTYTTQGGGTVEIDRWYMDIDKALYPEFFEYFNNLLTRIGRLRQKVTKLPPDGIADLVTVQDVIAAGGDDEEAEENVQYAVDQYVEEMLDENNKISGLRIYDTIFSHDIKQGNMVFGHVDGRIDELIPFYTKYHDQLSLLNIICEKTGGNWSVGTVWGVENGDYELANCKYQFEINETIYSFLTSTLAKQAKCVVNFDLLHRRINVTPVDKIGADTGIVIDYDTLLNSLHMQSDEAALCTRLNVRGGNDITLEQVNFGEPYVTDLSYKMNVKNSQGERIYVTDQLAEKYKRYVEYRDAYARPKYVEMTKRYNELTQEITDLRYRTPVNGPMSTDWGQVTDAELEKSLLAHQRLLYALLQLYGDDYAMPPDSRYWQEIVEFTDPNGVTQWGYPNDHGGYETLEPWFSGISAQYGGSHYIPKHDFILGTMYWWDYYAYHEILQQIKTAMAVRVSNTEDPGMSYANISNQDLLDRIKAWETEWSLYGSAELANKITAYEYDMQVMVDAVAVMRKHTDLATFKTRYAEAQGRPWSPSDANADEGVVYARMCSIVARHALWESLSPAQQSNFASSAIEYEAVKALIDIDEEIYVWADADDQTTPAADRLPDADKQLFGNVKVNYYAVEYNKALGYRNGAKDAKEALDAEIDAKNAERTELQEERMALADHLLLGNYTYAVIGDDSAGLADLESYSAEAAANEESFTATEQKCIVNLYRDADYTNENILTTSLNDIVDSLTHLQELYDDAEEQVSKLSRPQLQFTVDADNFLAIPEFAPFRDHFALGNYVNVAYRDGTYVRLRLVEYSTNPFLPHTGLSMQFSSYIRSQTEYTDVESVLGLAGSNGVSSYGGGSGGGGGNTAQLGEDLGIDITISNTMLGRLLQPGGLADSLSENLGISSLSAKELAQQIANAMRIGYISTGNAAIASGFNILTKQSAKDPVYAGLQEGSTVVSADCLRGGMIQSTLEYDELVYEVDENGDYRVDASGNRIPVLDEYGVQQTRQAPYSWLDMNNGKFSFGGGALTFVREDANHVGQLAVQGIVTATGGTLGGVVIGAATTNTPLVNNMILGNQGFYKYDQDSSGRIAEQFDLRPASGNEGMTDVLVPIGSAFLRFAQYLYNDSGNVTRDMHAVVSSRGVVFRVKDLETNTNRAFTIDTTIGDPLCAMSGNMRLFGGANLYVLSENSSSDNGIKLLSNGGIIQCRELKVGTTDSTKASISNTGNITTTNGTVHGANMRVTSRLLAGTEFGTEKFDSKQNTFCTLSPNVLRMYGSKYRIVIGNSGYYRTETITINGDDGTMECSGSVKANGTTLTGGDYAEYFEWLDGNVELEDRRGRFVTMDGDKIKLASSSGDYLLGIVTSTPSVTGNSAWREWRGKYMRDVFGAIITEPVAHPTIVDEDGNIIEEARVVYEPVINPEYDPTREYIPREQRPEWAPVGLVGQIVMLDDGTCEVNGFATSADEGIATKADGITNYRVIKRIDSNHIMVAAK